MDTIFALATAPGRAGVAIVRISGPEAAEVAKRLVTSLPAVRGLRKIRDMAGEILDEALVLQFADNHSFSGEPVVEFHLHGSPAIAKSVQNAVSQAGARIAEAGEFTRRALDNGKLDLAQVEGLADLIDAETEEQRKQAMRVFAGGLGDLAECWRKDLIRAAALIEATIDFADEEVPVDVTPEVGELLCNVQAQMEQQIAGVSAAERIREGFEVAIVGPPNIGKSTLLNRLAGRDAAITSEIAGTTRDVIEVRMDIGGMPVTLLDTAGIRQAVDKIEVIGIERALSRARDADLRLFLIGDGDKPALDPLPGDIIAFGKGDTFRGPDLAVSGKTGKGIDQIIAMLNDELSGRVGGVGVAIRDRHRIAMKSATGAIGIALDGLAVGTAADLLAEDIRAATRAVDMIVGRVDVEDLLSEIFASFCIGK